MRGEEETEISREDVVWVDRMVMNEEEVLGEFRCKSSSIYLSMSSKNSNIPNWYIAMTKDPSTLRDIYFSNKARKEGLLGRGGKIGRHEV